MKSPYLIALFAAIALSGCATDFGKYADNQGKIGVAEQMKLPATAEQMKAIAGDDPTAKVAAIMGITFLGVMDKQGGGSSANLQTPYSAGQFMRDLAGLAVPLASIGSNIYAAKKGADVAIAAQNASRDVALGDQRARVDSLSVVGNATTGIVTGLSGVIGEAVKRPTTQVTVTGNNNTTGGRDATTNTVECAQTQTNRSGDPTSGNGGTNGAGGGSTGGAATATQSKECVAGK